MLSASIFSTTLRILNKTKRIKLISVQPSIFNVGSKATEHLCCSSRIICTDSALHGPYNHKTLIHKRNESKSEAMCFPGCLLEEQTKTVDHYYLRSSSIMCENGNIEDLMFMKEFKDVLARSSFFYDVNLAESSRRGLPFSGVYSYSFENIYHSSLGDIKNKETFEVFLASSSEVNPNDSGKPTEEQLLFVIDKLTQNLINFFAKPHNYSIYHQNIVFQNNIKGVTIKGLNAYIQAMYLLKVYGFVQYAKVKVEILKITHHTEDGTIRVRWRVKGIARHKILLNLWRLNTASWRKIIRDESDWLDGFSIFSVGPDSLIYQHICDKMTPDDDTVKSKSADLKSRLMGLFQLSPRGPAGASLSSLVPCYRNQDFAICKKLT